MSTSSKAILATSLLLLLLVSPGNAAAGGFYYTNQFQYWYPQYGFVFDYFLHQNCSQQYDNYLTGFKNQSLIDWYGGGGTNSVLTQAVTNCILTCTSEYLMATMTSAQVMLGVTPTILALLGSSAEETAMLWVVGRRPLLSLMLGAGSPSLYFSRAFEYRDPKELLRNRKGRMTQWRPSSSGAAYAVAAAEYACAAAAVVNITTAVYQLGLQTICIFISDGIIGPLLWWVLGIAPHIGGAIISRLRIRRLDHIGDHQGDGVLTNHQQPTAAAYLRALPRRLLSTLARMEPRPCVTQDAVHVGEVDEGPAYIALSWMLSAGTICHIIFGTLVFSNTLFIGPRDAMGVIGRLMGSVLICRIILMYELAGLREAYNRTMSEGPLIRATIGGGFGGVGPGGGEKKIVGGVDGDGDGDGRSASMEVRE